MNFNPQNEQGLLGLVAALKNNMDPGVAYSVFQNIQQDQAAQVAQRQQRLSGLAELLMGAATQGMPYEGAEALAEAAPGPMGPAVQQMMASLYPTADQSLTNASGATMDFPAGNRPTPEGVTPINVSPSGVPISGSYATAGPFLGAGDQATSPTFMPQVPSPTEAIAMQTMEQEQAITADLTALQADAAAKKADGWTLDQYLAAVQKANPQLFAVAPDLARKVLEGTFGPNAYDMLGITPEV